MLRKTRFLLFLLILIPCISHAEIKIFTHTVNQPFGGSQSPDDARVSAMAKAKREVLEKAGTYLETMTVIKNHEVEKDEILALAAAVLKAEIVSQKNYAKENTFGIVIKAKVKVDTSILDERVKNLLKDSSLFDKYKNNQKREKKLLARITELERDNQKLKSLPQKEQKQKRETLKNQFKIVTQGLTASGKRDKAMTDYLVRTINKKRVDLKHDPFHNPDASPWLITKLYSWATGIKAANWNFIAYTNGIVEDTSHKLEWYAAPDRKFTYDQTKSWIKNLVLDGGGWRLPTVTELRSLIIEKDGMQLFAPFIRIPSSSIWAIKPPHEKAQYSFISDTALYGESYESMLYFEHFFLLSEKSDRAFVLAVRSK